LGKFGGNWNNGANAGSRCSNWNNYPWNNNNNIGMRGRYDILNVGFLFLYDYGYTNKPNKMIWSA
jgi:hypothetical protein